MAKEKRGNPQLVLRVPPKLLDQLRKSGETFGLNPQQVAMRAIVEFLEKRFPPEDRPAPRVTTPGRR